MNQEFIRDELPLDPPDSRNLEKLVLTLPVFEAAADDRKQYVSRNTSVIHSKNEWSIIGEGAQDDIKVIRLQSSVDGHTQVKVIRNPGSEFQSEYFLERVRGGWLHLNRSNKSFLPTGSNPANSNLKQFCAPAAE